MTMQEAYAAALRREPVLLILQNREYAYDRILEVGYRFTGGSGQTPFLLLLDERRNSTISASPEQVRTKERHP